MSREGDDHEKVTVTIRCITLFLDLFGKLRNYLF